VVKTRIGNRFGEVLFQMASETGGLSRAIQSGVLWNTSDFVLRLCAMPSWVSKSFASWTSGFLNEAEMHAKRMRGAAFRRQRKA
jgi:hypothetical protein